MESETLNKELLSAAVGEEKADAPPKRNTKDDLIGKIINICADHQLELEYSNTKLQRMTKNELARVLGAKIELGVKAQMAAQVGAKANAPDRVIALGALKMIHNIAAGTAERSLNMFLRLWGSRTR